MNETASSPAVLTQPHIAPKGAMVKLAVWLGAALLLAMAIGGSSQLSRNAAKAAVGMRPAQVEALAAMTDGEQAAVLSKGEQAQERNALIPVSQMALEKPGGFSGITQSSPSYGAALQCLSQAIYYEAANEPVTGKKAVAQVVLNRMRHPAYPSSVCGVVYEGSNRSVCQFSFTCDGSLLRRPGGPRWAESQRVAAAALNGASEPSVGTATHYHADYVLPRWAFTLAKIEKIGAHIFYRFPGNAGQRRAFSAKWAGIERIPTLDYARLQAELDRRSGAGDAAVFANGLTVEPLVTDRHAASDVGGRLDTTKEWRLTIPDPQQVSAGYHSTIAGQVGGDYETGQQAAQ